MQYCEPRWQFSLTNSATDNGIPLTQRLFYVLLALDVALAAAFMSAFQASAFQSGGFKWSVATAFRSNAFRDTVSTVSRVSDSEYGAGLNRPPAGLEQALLLRRRC